MTDRTCDLPGCDQPRYQNRDLCVSHYMKRWRYGDPYYVAPSRAEDLTGRRFGALVVTERNGREWSCRCDCGAMTLTRTGDLNRGSAISCGDRAKHNRADTVTNEAAHQRVRSDRGRAADYPCVDCGGQAKHWSYDHTDPHELPDAERGPYSLDVNRYHPRCVSCHKRFDLKHIAEVAA